jgi:hypothetical protein
VQGYREITWKGQRIRLPEIAMQYRPRGRRSVGRSEARWSDNYWYSEQAWRPTEKEKLINFLN